MLFSQQLTGGRHHCFLTIRPGRSQEVKQTGGYSRLSQQFGVPVKYSWHSFRVALACSLLASGASHAEIQALCRWQSEASLQNLCQDVPSSIPRRCSQQRMVLTSAKCNRTLFRVLQTLGIAQELNKFTVPESLVIDALPPGWDGP